VSISAISDPTYVYELATFLSFPEDQLRFLQACVNLDLERREDLIVADFLIPDIPPAVAAVIVHHLLGFGQIDDAIAIYRLAEPKPENVEQYEIYTALITLSHRFFEALTYVRNAALDFEGKKRLIRKMFEVTPVIDAWGELLSLPFTPQEVEAILELDFPSEEARRAFCLQRKCFEKVEGGDIFLWNP
jgi:hypothetical protein